MIRGVCLCCAFLVSSCSAKEIKVQTPQASVDSLRATVSFLADSLHGRGWTQPQNQERALVYLETRFASWGLPCHRQKFTVPRGDFSNLVCQLQGESDSQLVLGAHFDTYDTLAGADDNASGVAGLLESARRLSQGPKPPLTLVFVAFNLEEPPHFRTEAMGSAHYARSAKKSRQPIKGMVALEMIGFFSDSAIQRYPSFFLDLTRPSQANFIAAVSDKESSWLAVDFERAVDSLGALPVERLSTSSSLVGVDFSDHLNFWKEGIPAFMVTNTSFFRNRNYHRASDRVATLDFLRMAHVVDGVVAFARRSR